MPRFITGDVVTDIDSNTDKPSDMVKKEKSEKSDDAEKKKKVETETDVPSEQ